MHEEGDELRFEVADDGVGFDPAASHNGMGLQNLNDRLAALDGRLAVTSAPGRGAVVAGTLPLRDKRPEPK
jgi:signal transduction histidine kinase